VDVYVTAQLAALPLPVSVQVAAPKLPLPLDVKLTVPVGTVAAPSVLSVTVAVHVVAPPTATVAGVQLTVVVVGFGAAYAGWLNARKVNAAATATVVKRARANPIVPPDALSLPGWLFSPPQAPARKLGHSTRRRSLVALAGSHLSLIGC